MHNIMVSVIIVSKNAGDSIAETIESVLCQTYNDVEIVFVDGNSEDSTNDIISGYIKQINDKGYKVIHISEPDDGIYYAMNKGIDYSHGEWLYFLNANDCLYDCDVISDVVKEISIHKDIGCIYGNTLNRLNSSCFERKGLPMETIYYRAPFVHQALFSRRSVVALYKFDIKWKTFAEYDQFLRMYLDGIIFYYFDRIIAKYDLKGVSQRNNLKNAIEREKIQEQYLGANKNKFRRLIRNAIVILVKSNTITHGVYIKIMKMLGNLEKKYNAKG